MGLLDVFKNALSAVIKNTQNTPGANPQQTACKSESIAFAKIPYSLEELKVLPQAALATPFDTAALTVLALCVYPKNKEESLKMLEFLSGPRELSQRDRQFINDRFMDGVDYVPRSYFNGAVPGNDYTPSIPYTITVKENPYSYDNEGYAKLFITSGGADTDRYVQLRKAKDGKWYLWEQFLLVGIRQPESANPWA